MSYLIKLYYKYKEAIDYLFWGFMTTLVNYTVYFSGTKIFRIHYLVSNILAWCIAVVFAYVVNKIFVFQSKSWHRAVVMKEFSQFTTARFFSGVLETLMLLVFVDYLLFNEDLIKIIASVVVVILNYIFSKWFIFKK